MDETGNVNINPKQGRLEAYYAISAMSSQAILTTTPNCLQES